MTPSERAKAALRYQNRKNRAQGAFFEQMINGACDFYRSRQIADIEKTPEPMQPTKDLGGGKFIAHYTSTAQADYKGFLFGGRAVNFEAKYTDVEKMTQDRVTADQTERLGISPGRVVDELMRSAKSCGEVCGICGKHHKKQTNKPQKLGE